MHQGKFIRDGQTMDRLLLNGFSCQDRHSTAITIVFVPYCRTRILFFDLVSRLGLEVSRVWTIIGQVKLVS